MATKIIFFNHKGGVSKTTTTYNIGWKLAQMNKRILLVDADPQCNLTGLLMGDDFEEYYFNPATNTHNIKDGVKAAFDGRPEPIRPIDCYNSPQNPNLFLLAGHANLSEYDAALSFAQNANNAIATLQNLPGAFNELIEQCANTYNIDYVLIDLNPGLSAINQNLFILSDGFVIPTNPDPFSVMAITTLSKILPRWVEWADKMRPVFADASYQLSDSRPKFIGELIQRFNVRKGRAARPYRDNIQEIKNVVRDNLYPALKREKMVFKDEVYQACGIPNDFCLAEIPDFQGLLPKSNDALVPVFAISDEQIHESGAVLAGMIQKRDEFDQLFTQLANKIICLEPHAKSV